ncbi:MAG: hypothetical protein K2Q11_04525 [Burkholderiaceae bacterium]|nr:hypothetical protein [Burkholderiaceae bacterium]
MNTTPQKSIESCLKSYEGYIEFWSEDVGDTEQLFKLREHIHERLAEVVLPLHKAVLRKIDDKLLKLVEQHQDSQSWDYVMLRQTGGLIKDERY